LVRRKYLHLAPFATPLKQD